MSETIKLSICPRCGAAIPAEAPQGLCPKCVLGGAAHSTETGVSATATGEIPSIERIASAFPQLEILELIGRGGMGFVFKARQPHLDRFVALKLLPDKLAKDPQFAERFNREGRFLAKLNHPNIVSVFDFGQAGGFYFLLMEYVDGVNLRQAMRAGRFSPAEALGIVPKICEALQYAHEQGVLHRDIKPENILLDSKGRVKIADFGIAKLVGEDAHPFGLTATGAALGTPHYMAPEQLEKPGEIDHRADIYSLGVVFYEMLTGELPIGRFKPPSERTPLDQRVDEIVMCALERERELRQKDATELKSQVEHVTATPGSSKDRAGAGGGRLNPVLSKNLMLVKRPAQALLVTGIFNWVGSIIVIALLLWTALGENWVLTPSQLVFVGALILLSSSVIIIGSLKMMKVEAYPLAVAASVLAMITTPGSIIGLPIGLWALISLCRADVRAAFKSEPARASFDVPAWSQKAVWAAVLTGMCLPLPMLFAVFVFSNGGRPGGWEILMLIAGMAGTILGWMGLSDIRAHQGKLRGLPLAVFAALTLPLLLLVAGTLVISSMIAYSAVRSGGLPLVAMLVLLVPAGAITFAIWTVFSAARWGSNKPPSQRRGVLKWIFLTLALFGVGVLITFNLQPVKQVHYVNDGSPATPVDTNARPWIRFTFTAVELREVQGVRWLAIDYLDDVHGECQKAFPWETTIPGFQATTRASEFLKEAKDSSPAVRHQRIEYRMPDSSPREQLEQLRDNLEKTLKQKSFRLELGESEVPLLLFELPGVEGGSLKARIKVIPPITEMPQPVPFNQQPERPAVSSPSGNVAEHQTVAARLDTLRSKERQLLSQYKEQHPLVKRIREQIAETEVKIRAMEGGTNDLHTIQIRLARDQFAETQKRFAIGVIGQDEVDKAARDLEIAEARGNAAAVARANLKFAESALAVARKRRETGLNSETELRQAELEHVTAQMELHQALNPASPLKWREPEDERAYQQLSVEAQNLRQKAEQLRQQYTAEHPLVQRANQQLREAEKTLKALQEKAQ